MARGTITRLIRSHGYFYIRRDDGYELFFLRSELKGEPYQSLREGQHVEFEVTRTPRGTREVEVRLAGEKS